MPTVGSDCTGSAASPQPGAAPLRLPSPGGLDGGRGTHCWAEERFFQPQHPEKTRTVGIRRKKIRYTVVVLPVILWENWEHRLCHCDR